MGGRHKSNLFKFLCCYLKKFTKWRDPQRIPKGLQWKKKLTLDLKKRQAFRGLLRASRKTTENSSIFMDVRYLKCLVTWVKKPLYIPI